MSSRVPVYQVVVRSVPSRVGTQSGDNYSAGRYPDVPPSLASFQRCMMAIFSDLIEHIMEVFMDDFSVYAKDYDQCLENFVQILKALIEILAVD